MLEINGTKYQIILLDTNIVSETLKYKNTIGNRVIDFIYKQSIPCFSPVTLKELKSVPKTYNAFFDIFNILPSILIKDYHQLAEEELRVYKGSNKVNPFIATIFKNPFEKININIRKICNSFFTPEFMTQFENDKKSILTSILNLKPNYPSNGKAYTKKEIDFFIFAVVTQLITLYNYKFARAIVDSGNFINLKKFPSIQTIAAFAFYKFYISNRRPRLSDIPDLMISSAYPYVDVVITEKNQAELLRQIKKRHEICSDTSVLTLSDFIG